MKTITEVAKITGIIPQRINDYEKAGLLDKPSFRNKYQYRLYSDKEIVRLWQIRFYKELGYTIPQMKKVFTDPAYQPEVELAKQIRLLEEKKRKIETLLLQAKAMQRSGLDLAVAYEVVPGVNHFTYDEAAKFAFPIWSKAILAAVKDAKAEEEEGENDSDDEFFEDLDGVLELFESGCDPSDSVVQARLRALKQRHGMPLAALLWILETRESKEALLEAFGNALYQTFRDAVKIAAEAEYAEMQAQTQISINRLVRMKSVSPEQAQVQEEVARFLRSVSYGVNTPEDPENPKDFEIEALETLIRQYEDRDSAVYAVEYRMRLTQKARAGKASGEAQAEAKGYTDHQHEIITETLVPALRVYLKNMKEKAERRNAVRQDRNE
ncbi:MAG: MerR family transcriptional regulator [Treponema sp.]|nr:MerR family transcriptional regulator [Treponema sp.]MBR6122319.1 MerR family transcriptional regulator [Candidatus Saccharibacteria bacterium]